MQIYLQPSGRGTWRTVIRWCLWLFAIAGATLQAQTKIHATQDHLDLIININNVATQGEFELRGLTANFPYPILSTISVVDSAGNIVPRLADTLRWLGRTDMAENCWPIAEIWRPILEYHEENQHLPPNPNPEQQQPPPLVTEVRWTDPIPVKTMLVMDVSSSMVEEMADAIEGLELYINHMRSIDRTGLVQFTGKVDVIVPMTGDTALLKRTVNTVVHKPATAIYDALQAGIKGLKSETNRRGVIIYTDGKDNSSKTKALAVIDSAKTYNLPIYTIALGTSTQEDTLKMIADSTNGLFLKAATAKEMQLIFGKLSVIMQNYYVMAHASPDPYFNRTWRLVDVTVNLPDFNGRGRGRYFVPGRAKHLQTDLEVTLAAITDSTRLVSGDTINVVYPGEPYQYAITVRNLGLAVADSVKLIQLLPDSVRFLQADPAPEFTGQPGLSWEINELLPQERVTFSVKVQLSQDIPQDWTTRISTATIAARNDTNLMNNFATDTVFIRSRPLPPRPKFNLAITQQVLSDTSIRIAGQLFPAVLRANQYRYRLKVQNFGPVTARDFNLWDILPDSVHILSSSLNPSSQQGDSLFWKFDALARGDSLTVEMEVLAPVNLPVTPRPLVNVSGVTAKDDTLAHDNLASTLIYAMARATDPQVFKVDVALFQSVLTDSLALVGRDTLRFVGVGETYTYTLKVTNLSAVPAQAVIVSMLLPDSVRVHTFQPAPSHATPDSLIWSLGVLLPQTTMTLDFKATVAAHMPTGRNLLSNQAWVTAANEDPTRLANNMVASTVINLVHTDSDWQPLIEAIPAVVKSGNSITVRVQVTAPVAAWDLRVYLANGQMDTTYGDAFIAAHGLPPAQWTVIDPTYTDTKLPVDVAQAELVFEIRAVDFRDQWKSARATVTIESEGNEDVIIDRDVFIPDQDFELPIKFKLKSDSEVVLQLYDITGTRITKIVESQFRTGWNTYHWNGLTENGQKIGSGFYILTVRSNEYQRWKKLMLVR